MREFRKAASVGKINETLVLQPGRASVAGKKSYQMRYFGSATYFCDTSPMYAVRYALALDYFVLAWRIKINILQKRRYTSGRTSAKFVLNARGSLAGIYCESRSKFLNVEIVGCMQSSAGP